MSNPRELEQAALRQDRRKAQEMVSDPARVLAFASDIVEDMWDLLSERLHENPNHFEMMSRVEQLRIAKRIIDGKEPGPATRHTRLLAAAKSAVAAVNGLISESDDPFDMPPPWLDDLEQAIREIEKE